jgi:CheY-like chemotaxis protein
MRSPPRKSDNDAVRNALLVEADAGTRAICRSALECLGFTVNAVDSGVAAVARARQINPDIVLFDLQLGDARGSELLSWLRSNPALERVPMIAISVLADADAVEMEKRVDGFLRKPVSRALLKATVRHAFQSKSRNTPKGIPQ